MAWHPAECLNNYLQDAILPELVTGLVEAADPWMGSKAHHQSLVQCLERPSPLSCVRRFKASWFDAQVKSFTSNAFPDKPIYTEVEDAPHNERFTVPCSPYFKVPEIKLRSATDMTGFMPWVDNFPLETVQRIMHLKYGASDWSLSAGGGARNDSESFRYFTWSNSPRENEQKISVVIITQPPWVLTESHLQNFVSSESYHDPTRTTSSQEMNTKDRLWAKVRDVCTREGACYFVVTSYVNWAWGALSEDGSAAFTSHVKRYDSTRPTVLASLVFWFASAMGKEGGWGSPRRISGVPETPIPSRAQLVTPPTPSTPSRHTRTSPARHHPYPQSRKRFDADSVWSPPSMHDHRPYAVTTPTLPVYPPTPPEERPVLRQGLRTLPPLRMTSPPPLDDMAYSPLSSDGMAYSPVPSTPSTGMASAGLPAPSRKRCSSRLAQRFLDAGAPLSSALFPARRARSMAPTDRRDAARAAAQRAAAHVRNAARTQQRTTSQSDLPVLAVLGTRWRSTSTPSSPSASSQSPVLTPPAVAPPGYLDCYSSPDELEHVMRSLPDKLATLRFYEALHPDAYSMQVALDSSIIHSDGNSPPYEIGSDINELEPFTHSMGLAEFDDDDDNMRPYTFSEVLEIPVSYAEDRVDQWVTTGAAVATLPQPLVAPCAESLGQKAKDSLRDWAQSELVPEGTWITRTRGEANP